MNLKYILLAAGLAAVPNESKAEVKVLLGVGTGCHIALDTFTKNGSITLAEELANANLSLQIEHYFGKGLVQGFNFEAAVISITSYGYFFGGQIYKTDKTTCYMKGGIDFILFVRLLFDKAMTLNPYIEFAWHQDNKIVHAVQVGLTVTMEFSHEIKVEWKKNVSLKYKIMWEIN